MRYVSTRGEAPELEFEDVLLTGLARDGGLYVPAEWPQFTRAELNELRGRPYADVAFAVIGKFTGEAVPEAELKAMITEAYESFDHVAVTPLKQLNADQWLLELFHGPTLAFKDVAMQFLARVMDWALARRGMRATIVGATSGDTGGAAIEAFKASRHASVFILHPHDKVSEVQRRQMTTVISPSVHNIALEGTFDDCQAILKALFNDHAFRDRATLAGVNSINWARIMAQIVYYVTASLALSGPGRLANFTVPTGNFGDIFAGLAAKRMGAPIGRLVIATNENDILDRTLRTGRYEVKGVKPSSSPSMDIQVSSNFERLLFEAYGRDPDAIRGLMAGLAQSGSFTIEEKPLQAIRSEFTSGAAGMSAVAAEIARTLQETGELLDPHTAVGYAVARKERGYLGPMVTLATAHPAKFPDAVEAAAGTRPGLPPRLAPLMMAEERVSVLANDPEAVKAFISERVAG
ncbi:threonine synthase [Nordella sp. HKS 07]|uniref:threonine synthase n=1 Tax=Nordella sp. HKS 07 TaxID=2712222 RepID=UPI0013E166C4|nr:threonine synthase [Nordella sp. HKS 07]QIG49171.1 threonine synthase [Nordella sp. HKS 07]